MSKRAEIEKIDNTDQLFAYLKVNGAIMGKDQVRVQVAGVPNKQKYSNYTAPLAATRQSELNGIWIVRLNLTLFELRSVIDPVIKVPAGVSSPIGLRVLIQAAHLNSTLWSTFNDCEVFQCWACKTTTVIAINQPRTLQLGCEGYLDDRRFASTVSEFAREEARAASITVRDEDVGTSIING